MGRPLHTGFEPRSLAGLACSTGQSATTYTTVGPMLCPQNNPMFCMRNSPCSVHRTASCYEHRTDPCSVQRTAPCSVQRTGSCSVHRTSHVLCTEQPNVLYSEQPNVLCRPETSASSVLAQNSWTMIWRRWYRMPPRYRIPARVTICEYRPSMRGRAWP